MRTEARRSLLQEAQEPHEWPRRRMCGPSSWLTSHFPHHRRGLSVLAGAAADEDVNATARLSDRIACLAFTTATQPRMQALVQPVPLAVAGAPTDRAASPPPCIPDTWPVAQSVALRTVPTKRCLNGARWVPDAPRAKVIRQCTARMRYCRI